MDWLEENTFWGLLITVLVGLLVCSGYIYEKNSEKNSGPQQFGYFSLLEFPLIDLRHQWAFQPESIDDEIVVVTITETALERYQNNFGRWPWPRSVMAEVINYMGQADSIMLDIGFIEPSGKEVPPSRATEWLKSLNQAQINLDKQPDTSLKRLQLVAQDLEAFAFSGDKALGKSLGQHGRAFTSSWFANVTTKRPPRSELIRINSLLKEHGYQIHGADNLFPLYSYVTTPIKPVQDNSYGQAQISYEPDPDGVARRFFPFSGVKSFPDANFQPDKPYLPFLGMAAVLEELDLAPGSSQIKVENQKLLLADQTIPLDHKGRILIRYRGGLRPKDSSYSTYKEVPIQTIIQQIYQDQQSDTITQDFFKGKKVFVGSTATGARDLISTPYTSQEAGVAVHANIYDMIINETYLHPIEPLETIAGIVGLTVLVGLVTIFLPPLKALAVTILLVFLFIGTGFGLFYRGHLINLSAPMLSALLAYVSITIYNLIFAQHKRRQIRTAFESYLPPSVLKEVLKEPEELELGGERQEITLLFADIAGFTSFSEGKSATEVASVIGDIMTDLTGCIFQHEGVLDKYIGDELVAEFGIVAAEPDDHARRACLAALDMREKINELQQKWRENDEVILELRIGMHTGPAATGNMGSEQLFDYTAIGDNVNLGSRLEGANKKYNTLTMLSEVTYDRVREEFIARELDLITVKGKNEPIRVYELLGLAGEVDEDILELKERFEEALGDYRDQKWDPAIDKFTKLADDFPDDGPAKVFLDRAKTYRNDPPEEDWDGVYRMKTK